MSYKLICFDLDGTLLQQDFSLPPAHIHTVNKLRQRGYRITLATGRSKDSAQPYMDLLAITEPMVFSNGSVLYDPIKDHRKVLTGIPLLWAKRVIALEKEHPLSLKAHLADGSILKSKDLPWPDEGVHFVVGTITLNLLESLTLDPIKIVLFGSDQEIQDFQAALAPLLTEPDCPIRMFRTHHHYVEITNSHVSKGSALNKLLPQMGLKKEEVVCVGDQENDYEMLRDFGLGIRVGDGCERLKEVATYRLDSPEQEGIKELLRLLP